MYSKLIDWNLIYTNKRFCKSNNRKRSLFWKLYNWILNKRNNKSWRGTKGLCNSDTRTGIFRRKSNLSRSRLSVSSQQSSSCPTSPRQCLRQNSSSISLRQMDTTATSPTEPTTSGLHRSASTVSAIRPRSSPSGLFSYTGNQYFHFATTKKVEYFLFI